MSELNDFVELSVYAGQRFDWVQAGGGNTSVQLGDGTFCVKASGLNLTELSARKGYTRLNRGAVLSILEKTDIPSISDPHQQESEARIQLDESVTGGEKRASIEAYMHVLFDRFTLHTHPIGVNIIGCRKDWREKFQQIFGEALCVAYATPGFPLALALYKAIKKYEDKHGRRPSIVFIQNHGLIVTAEDTHTVIKLAENVSARINEFLNRNDEPFIWTTAISRLMANVAGTHWVSLASNDQTINAVFQSDPGVLGRPPFSPDGITFCGYKAVEITDIEDDAPIRQYLNKYEVLPQVLVFNGYVFCVARSLRKAKEIEDVLRFQLTVMREAGDAKPLSRKEQDYLTHWEAEKYRQGI